MYINQKKGNITGQNSSESIRTYVNSGQADIDGPFGFTGDCKAWHLADDLRIPLEARIKVWLGSVKVEIINYQKVRR